MEYYRQERRPDFKAILETALRASSTVPGAAAELEFANLQYENSNKNLQRAYDLLSAYYLHEAAESRAIVPGATGHREYRSECLRQTTFTYNLSDRIAVYGYWVL